MSPVLSVIIPVYNMDQYIGQCLSSIFKLKDPAIEIIVVDDGSTDRTNLVLHSFTDQRLRIITQTNSGPSAARNVGFANSRGRFILPFDADDIPVAENWHLMVAALEANPKAVLAYGASRAFKGANDNLSRTLLPTEFCPATDKVVPLIFKRNFMLVGSAVIRREALARAGPWNETLRVGEDWELWCRLACLGPFAFCPVLAVGYRQHCRSATGAPVSGNAGDPALAAIEAIYSNPLVGREVGDNHRKLKREALAWQTYHWGTRLIRNRAFWAGAKAIFWAISRDHSHLFHACGYPKRRFRRWMESRESAAPLRSVSQDPAKGGEAV